MRHALAPFVAVAALALSGCSDTSPENRTDALFDVANKTATPFTRVSIRAATTGAEVYAGAFDCAPGREDCKIRYAGDRLDGPLDFTFSDDRGALVAAYRLAGAPEVYESLDVTARSTGAYLIDQLLRVSPALASMDQAQREARARHYARNYDSPDGVTDYHEEMAAHYAYRMARDGLSVPRFLEVLAGRLLDFDAAGAEEFVPQAGATAADGAPGPLAVRERAVDSADGSCSTALGNVLTVSGSVAFGVQGAFPIAGTIMSAVVGLLQSSCDDTASRLDVIDSRLNELQVSLDSLADRLGELRNFTARASINTGEDAFQSLAQNVDRLASTFRAMKQNYRVASLREYVQVVGAGSPTPLRATLTFEGGVGPLSDLLRHLRPAGLSASDAINPLGGVLLQQFDTLLRDGALSTIVEAVRLQCDDPPFGDAIRLRVNCNLFLGSSVARLVAAHRVAGELAGEVYDLLDTYKVSERDTVAQYSYLIARSAADHRAALSAVFRGQQDKLLTTYRDGIVGNPDPTQRGMYNTQRGLGGLLDSLGASSCYDDRLRLVAVTGWVRSASAEYLETQCRNVGIPVPARYHLVIDRVAVNSRTNVCNVMGVPVPCDRLRVAQVYNNLRVSTWAHPSVPLAFALTSGAPRAGRFAVHANHAYDAGVRSVSARPIPAAGDGLRLLNAPSATGDRGIADLSQTTPIQHFFESPSGAGFSVSWLRYTRADGTSVALALTAWTSIEFRTSPGSIFPQQVTVINTTLSCVTGDCNPGSGLRSPLNVFPISGPFGLDFLDGPAGLSFGDYGWKVSAADFPGTRDQYGFFVKQGAGFLPLYPR